MTADADLNADEQPGRRQRRVLVLFGHIPLLGQERGNIQVFYALQRMNVDALFVTNRDWGYAHVQPALDALGLNWTEASYTGRFRKGMGIGEWARALARIVSGSVTLLRLCSQYKPTHIHICNIEHFINFLPALVLTRVPVIYRLGDVPAIHREAFRTLWRRVVVPRVSSFVCVSEYVRCALLDLGASETKCSVIYSEAPVRVRSVTSGTVDKVHKGREFTVLYAGQLTRDKGIDVLVGAAMRMCRARDNIEFLIAGDYEWQNKFATTLKESVRAAGMSDRIRFLGYVDAIQDLFRLADIHVLPSVWEDPMPNVVIEAKHAAIASVVFPSGGVPEVVEHECDGFICADRTEMSLISGIGYYIEVSGRASVHGRNAYSSIARLGITRFGEQWNAVYADG